MVDGKDVPNKEVDKKLGVGFKLQVILSYLNPLSSSVFLYLFIIYGANQIIILDPLHHIISSISLYDYIHNKKTLQLPDPELLDPQYAAVRLYVLSHALKSHRQHFTLLPSESIVHKPSLALTLTSLAVQNVSSLKAVQIVNGSHEDWVVQM